MVRLVIMSVVAPVMATVEACAAIGAVQTTMYLSIVESGAAVSRSPAVCYILCLGRSRAPAHRQWHYSVCA